jgi:cytochrome c oxidase subunit 2
MIHNSLAAFTWFSPKASTFAEETDSTFMFITWVSVIFFVLIVALMAYFVLKYRRKSEDDVTPNISHNLALEVVWSIVPIILVMIMFYWGYTSFAKMMDPSGVLLEADEGEKPLDLYVKGYQWYWEITYPTGVAINSKSSLKLNDEGKATWTSKKFDAEDFASKDPKKMRDFFVVPVDTPVRLNMTSNDVIHSFAVPAFRIKRDVNKNRSSVIWFKANKIGEYIYTCNEMCGIDHGHMIGYLRVVSKEDYKTFIEKSNVDTRSPWEVGRDTYKAKCSACHSLDEGVRMVGPPWYGLWGKKNHEIEGGTVAEVDYDYIKESSNIPNAKIAKGFGKGLMPPQNLKDKEIMAIVEFMKSPDANPNPTTENAEESETK